MGYDNYKLRAAYDKNQKSLIGRFWRWYIGFCPGWEKYFKGLPSEKMQELSRQYNLK